MTEFYSLISKKTYNSSPKKNQINEFKKLIENDLQIDSFINETYKVLNQTKDESTDFSIELYNER